MKNKLFPIFITLLGFFTAYVFYALWHTEELNVKTIPTHIKKESIKDLSHKKVIPKHTLSLIVPTPSISSHKRDMQEEAFMKEMEEQIDIPFQKQAEMEAKTQEIYAALIPEGHEERMEEVTDAFEMLDEHVAEVDEQLRQEEEDNNL